MIRSIDNVPFNLPMNDHLVAPDRPHTASPILRVGIRVGSRREFTGLLSDGKLIRSRLLSLSAVLAIH